MNRHVCVLSTLLLVSGSVFAQSGVPSTLRFGEGTHAFRRILHDRGFAPAAEEALAPANLTLLVVLGDLTPLEKFDQGGPPMRLRRFLQRGGALLVASDRASGGSLVNNFSVRITGDPIVAITPLPPPYRGIPECPWVLPASRNEPALFVPTGMGGLGIPLPFVASNAPSRLARSPTAEPLPLLATINDLRAGIAAFSMGGEVGPGRVLILADHSVFINDMLLQADNGNLDFATRVADWLSESTDGTKRTRVLYYEDGSLRRDFDIPLRELPPPPLPTPDDLVPIVNQMLHGLEKENTFNDMLTGWVGMDGVWRGMAIGTCVLLGIYGFVRLSLFRYRDQAPTPSLPSLLPRHASTVPLLQQRTREQARIGHLGETVELVARHVFEIAGIAVTGAPPHVSLADGQHDHKLWRKRIETLWTTALHGRSQRITPRRCAELVAEANAVEAALRSRTIHLQVTDTRKTEKS